MKSGGSSPAGVSSPQANAVFECFDMRGESSPEVALGSGGEGIDDPTTVEAILVTSYHGANDSDDPRQQ